MKKWMTFAVIGALTCSALVFADTETLVSQAPLASPVPTASYTKPMPIAPNTKPVLQPVKPPGDQPVYAPFTKPQVVPVKPPAKAQLDAEKIGQHRANMSRIILKYAPDFMRRYKLAWREIDGLRKEIDLAIAELRNESQEELKARIDRIKADLAAKRLTKAEANMQIAAVKGAMAIERSTLKSTLDVLRMEYGFDEQQAKKVYQTLRVALEAKDQVQINKVLKLFLAQLIKQKDLLIERRDAIEMLLQ